MKKIAIIIGIALAALFVIIALFVGGIMGIVFYSIYNSDAAGTARNYLKTNEKLKSDIGEVKDFGSFVSGSVNSGSSGGQATLHMKVIGEKKTVNANVSLVSKENRGWRVTAADYVDDNGKTVVLFDPYEPQTSTTGPAASPSP
jgi:hypothetical protein